MKVTHCPICGNPVSDSLFLLSDLPVFVNVLADSMEKAKQAATGRQNLGLCTHCGFVMNTEFEAEKVCYQTGYHAERSNSPTYHSHLVRLVSSLYSYLSRDCKNILEVGCGTGEFLKLMNQYNTNQVSLYGVDPSTDPLDDGCLHLTQAMFDEQYLSTFSQQPDMVINRHMIEHIPNPLQLLQSISSVLPLGGMFYLETPRLEWILRHHTFFDFTYEHCSYFSDDFLKRLLKAAGFEILKMTSQYGDQYVSIYARKTASFSEIEPMSKQQTTDILSSFSSLRSAYQHCSEKIKMNNDWCVWGGSGKGVMWLNLFDPDAQALVIDINPYKHHQYILHCGHQILPPSSLNERKIKTILIMNSVFFKEIQNMVTSLLPNHTITFITAEDLIQHTIEGQE